MSIVFRSRWWPYVALAVTLILGLVLSSRVFAAGAAATVQVSSDPYTNSTSQHQTEVEPDSYSYGSTIVAATQVGRFSDGGASNIGWAASTDNGSTWKNGFLPGTTPYSTPAGSYDRLSDPSVAYDASHQRWMISSLAVSNTGLGSPSGVAVLVSISSDDGLTWNAPVVVANANGGFFDKDWIVCDDSASSPYYGHCYIEWDIASNNDLVQMSTSSDGGNTWGAEQGTADNATGLGGQPLVQPNGTVIVPFLGSGSIIGSASSISAFTSTNGGTSWSSSVTISSETDHQAVGIRTEPLPTAEIDGAGTAYVVWQDCRFESGCSANDLVMSTSSDGQNWSAVQRIPIDAVGSGVDHFIPGLAVDPATSGSSAHLALAYYYYPNANCTTASCQLEVGFVSSVDGGSSWSAPTSLTSGPMNLAWLANTTDGYMVGDYISTSFSAGKAFPAFVVASAPNGSQLNESLFTVSAGLTADGGSLVASSAPPVFTRATPLERKTAF
ncbi:MAG TPA: sialidase family protein [Ktedonobacteraceae bacterium]|nr:sialidase family protein [Ktedonobacteraceae bacterium]